MAWMMDWNSTEYATYPICAIYIKISKQVYFYQMLQQMSQQNVTFS